MTHVFEGEFVHQNLGRIRKEFRVDQMCEWETRKAAVRGLFFCEHGIVIDTCEELDHLDEQAMQYLNITLREKDFVAAGFSFCRGWGAAGVRSWV